MPREAKPLFRPDVLYPHLKAFTLPPSAVALRPKLKQWVTLLASDNAMKETELRADFFADVFKSLLGYRGPVEADGNGRYTFSAEKHVSVDGKYADAVLGSLSTKSSAENRIVIAVEGKGPLDPLDRPFAGRKRSAVEQGYQYAINLQCDWIIVTSMRQTRLYYKGADQQTYECFDIERIANDDLHLKRFIYLLGAERVVPANGGRCHLPNLESGS